MGVADRQFVADPHAAVELDHFMAEGERHLGDERARAVDRRREAIAGGRDDRDLDQRPGLFEHRILRHHAVLDRLEAAQRHPELLAGAQIFERLVEQPLHDPDRLGRARQRRQRRQRRDGAQRVPSAVERNRRNRIEQKRGGDRSIGQPPVANGQARRAGGDEPQADSSRVTSRSRTARGDDEAVDATGGRNDSFFAGQAVVIDHARFNPRLRVATTEFDFSQRDPPPSRHNVLEPLLAQRSRRSRCEQSPGNQDIVDQWFDHQPLAERFEQQRGRRRVESGTAIFEIERRGD